MNPIPFKDTPLEFQQDFIKKLESGEISFNTGEDNLTPWTKADIERLESALSKVFGWDKSLGVNGVDEISQS